MPDQFTEVKNVGLGGRMMNSIKGVLIGLVLFVVSFGVLYWNEGRAGRAAKLVKQATEAPEVSAAAPDQGAQGKLVAVKGVLTSGETLRDSITAPGTQQIVAVKPGKYLKLSRVVEMFAWEEEQRTETKKNVGGSETQETTYTYKTVWTPTPENSSEFKIQEGHLNPPMTLSGVDYTVEQASLGSLAVSPDRMELPPANKLKLTPETITYTPAMQAGQSNSQDFVFLGKGSLSAPQVGDLRVSFTYVPSDITVTAFGELDGTSLSPFVDQKNGTLYRAFDGTKDEALATMKSENSTKTWILRLVGFILMWVGLGMLFGPISTFLDILPVAGSISRGLIGFATFLVALALSIVTILVSMLLHNIIAVVVAGVVVVVVAVLVMKGAFKKKKMATA